MAILDEQLGKGEDHSSTPTTPPFPSSQVKSFTPLPPLALLRYSFPTVHTHVSLPLHTPSKFSLTKTKSRHTAYLHSLLLTHHLCELPDLDEPSGEEEIKASDE
jgi:hypothetical protein